MSKGHTNQKSDNKEKFSNQRKLSIYRKLYQFFSTKSGPKNQGIQKMKSDAAEGHFT